MTGLGAGAAVHADRVHRRRDGAVDGAAICPGGDDAGYLETLRAHVLSHGVPVAFYSDRHGIFG